MELRNEEKACISHNGAPKAERKRKHVTSTVELRKEEKACIVHNGSRASLAPSAQSQSADSDKEAIRFSYQGQRVEEKRAVIHEVKHLIARSKKI